MYNEQKPCNIDRSNDNVRREYKRYKKKLPSPDFSEVIDFLHPEQFESKISTFHLDITEDVEQLNFTQVGLKHPRDWKAYEVTTSPGFLVVPNPFISYGAQSHWVKQALTNYTKEPYPCNLDVLMKIDKTKSVWQTSLESSPDNSFINQLRWVHMGYHFDYNTVDYKLKKYHGFPKDLAMLTQTIAHVFGYPNYTSETGIINYYPEGSSMGGHTDHYEEDMGLPLIGYTFGQSAVYLIGGKTRDIKPEAIWVRSGDVMLMSGPSRIAFHAVPRIVTKPMRTAPKDIGTCPLVYTPTIDSNTSNGDNSSNNRNNDNCNGGDDISCNIDDRSCNDGGSSNISCDSGDNVVSAVDNNYWRNEMEDRESWSDFSHYLSNTRININIRQVHKYQKEE